jgi:L-aspartate oxidase
MRAVLDDDGRDDHIAGHTVHLAVREEPDGPGPLGGSTPARDELQRAMTEGAGVLRSSESLRRTRQLLDGVESDDGELRNLCLVAHALVTAADAREVYRGAHTRTDHPDTRDELRVRLVFT